MRAVKNVTVEQVVEAENGKIHLEGIKIAGKKYRLNIHNFVLPKGDERLDLDFNSGDFTITIDKEGVSFRREKYRPNHDHGDYEYLVVGIADNVMGVTKGEIRWLSEFPFKDSGRDFYRVQFDAVRVDY
jgi:hypothetical protein